PRSRRSLARHHEAHVRAVAREALPQLARIVRVVVQVVLLDDDLEAVGFSPAAQLVPIDVVPLPDVDVALDVPGVAGVAPAAPAVEVGARDEEALPAPSRRVPGTRP